LCSHAGRVLRFRLRLGRRRRASALNAPDARRRIAPDGRFPCSEHSPAASSCRLRRSAVHALFHPLSCRHLLRRCRGGRSPPPGGSGLRSRLRLPDAQNPNPGARVFSSSGCVCLHAAKPVAARTRRSARLATDGKTGARSSGQPGSRLRVPGDRFLPAGARGKARSGVEGAQPAERREVTM